MTTHMRPEDEAVVQLGACIAMLREAAKLLGEEGYPRTARNLAKQADEADAVWTKCVHGEVG